MVLLGMYYFARIGNAFEIDFASPYSALDYGYCLKFVEKRAVLLQLISWMECIDIYWESFMICYNCV